MYHYIPILSPNTQPLKKTGWVFGIVAFICGLEPLLALLLSAWIGNNVLVLISPISAIIGIVFGGLGRNTQARAFAYIGVLLSAPYLLLVLYVWCVICFAW